LESFRLELTVEQCWGAVAAAGLVAEQAAVRDLRRTLSRAIIGP
jgi:hypothetical protein